MSVGKIIFKTIMWIFGSLLFVFFSLAIVYKDDPIIRLSVRSIFVGVASAVSDVKELKDAIKKDIKREVKP